MFEILLSKKSGRLPGATLPYKNWRFDFVGLVAAAITIPELRLYDASGNVITSGYQDNATAIGSYAASYGPSKAFDGIVPQSKDDLSHWQYNGNRLNTWIAIWVPVPRSVSRYSIMMPVDNKYQPSASFQGYAPASWRLTAYNDDGVQELIDEQAGYTTPKWLEKVEHSFEL